GPPASPSGRPTRPPHSTKTARHRTAAATPTNPTNSTPCPGTRGPGEYPSRGVDPAARPDPHARRGGAAVRRPQATPAAHDHAAGADVGGGGLRGAAVSRRPRRHDRG